MQMRLMQIILPESVTQNDIPSLLEEKEVIIGWSSDYPEIKTVSNLSEIFQYKDLRGFRNPAGLMYGLCRKIYGRLLIKAVGATIKLSWDLASDTAKQVLQAMSLLAPESVPKRLLRQILDMQEAGGLSDPLDEAIDELDKKLSLIIDVDDDGDPRIHRLVAGFVRETSCYEALPRNTGDNGSAVKVNDEAEPHDRRYEAEPRNEAGLHEKVVNVVEREMSRVEDVKDTAAYWELDKVVPHADVLLISKFTAAEQTIDISNWLFQHYQKKGLYRLSEKYGREALNLAESTFETGHKIITRSQSNLAALLSYLGELPEAERLLREALESDKKNFEPGHRVIAIHQSNLALVLKSLGNLPEAEMLLREALEYDKKNFEHGHHVIARSQSNLATVLQDLGKLQEAELLLKDALESYKNFLGADHPHVAVVQSNLALVLWDLGKLPEAETLLKAAIESDKKSFEPGHPSIARSQSNLAAVLSDLGKLSEAEMLLREALESDKKSFELGHPTIATRLHNLATVLKNMGKDDEAMTMMQEAYKSWLAWLGPDHPSTQKSKAFLDEWKRG